MESLELRAKRVISTRVRHLMQNPNWKERLQGISSCPDVAHSNRAKRPSKSQKHQPSWTSGTKKPYQKRPRIRPADYHKITEPAADTRKWLMNIIRIQRIRLIIRRLPPLWNRSFSNGRIVKARKTQQHWSACGEERERRSMLSQARRGACLFTNNSSWTSNACLRVMILSQRRAWNKTTSTEEAFLKMTTSTASPNSWEIMTLVNSRS